MRTEQSNLETERTNSEIKLKRVRDYLAFSWPLIILIGAVSINPGVPASLMLFASVAMFFGVLLWRTRA